MSLPSTSHLTAENTVVDGAFGLANIPAALLKYDRDKDYAGMIVYLKREIASLTYLLREKLPRVKVDSREPVLPEVNERSYRFYLGTASGTTATASGSYYIHNLSFLDADAKNLQKDDYLMVNGFFYDGVHTWTTTYAYGAGDPEVLRVLDVGAAGSGHTTGYTYVTVQRAWGGALDTATVGTILTTYQLTFFTSATGEGSRSRKSIGKTVQTDYNYLQLFRESYEATDFELSEDVFFNERPETVNANLAAYLMLKKIEFSFWVGRRARMQDSITGKMLYSTGGVIPWIPKTTTNQINYGGVLTPVGMNAALKDIALLGGTEERWMFGGYSAITALNNAYDNKIRLNGDLSEAYKLRIQSIESSVGLKVNVLASMALTELGYDWDLFVLDLGTPETPYLQYMYQEDIYINSGRDGKGIQANDERIKKEEFVGDLGLIRRASTYQAHIFGITQQL